MTLSRVASSRAVNDTNKKGAVRQGLAEVTKIGGACFLDGGDCLRQFRKFELETATLYSYHTVRNYFRG